MFLFLIAKTLNCQLISLVCQTVHVLRKRYHLQNAVCLPRNSRDRFVSFSAYSSSLKNCANLGPSACHGFESITSCLLLPSKTLLYFSLSSLFVGSHFFSSALTSFGGVCRASFIDEFCSDD